MNAVGIAALILLALVRRRAVHAVVVPLLFAALVASTIVKVV